LLKNPECKNYDQYSEKFQGKLCLQSKRKFLKNPYFNAAKIFRANFVFQGKRKLFKILKDKNTFNTVNSGHILFFRTSNSCSNILNVNSILNTAKNFMTNSVFRASASSSKVLKDKNISVQLKISGKLYFSKHAQVVQNSE